MFVVGCSGMTGYSNNGVIVTKSLAGKPSLVGDKPIEFPLSSSPKSLKAMVTGYSGVNPDDVFVWKKYEDMTGVDVDWTAVKKSDRAEAVYTALTNKQNLDLILRCKLSSKTLSQYGEKGLLLDLAKDDLLKNNAPNCWAYLKSHPDALASIMNPDGTIYALPQVNSGAELRVSRKLFINKDWLARVGMSVPTTTQEFYQMLKVFKEQDANGNGDPNDEIPLCSGDWLSIQESFYGAFGLANRGVHNLNIDCDEATGKVRLIAATDGYKSFLDYFHTLYAEGLIDSNIFSITTKVWSNTVKNDLVGVFASTNLASLPADKTDNWIAIDKALTGPAGDTMWSAVRANFHSTGAAAIPATCSNSELALRWLDYFWTDEGTLFYHMGVEGETFVAKDDGTYDYTQAIYDEMTSGNKSFDDVIATYSPYPGGSNPTVEIAPYFMGGEMAVVPAAAARSLFEYGPKEYWPSFTFTDAESDRLDSINVDIEKYCDSTTREFIKEIKPLSDWDEYVAQLESLNSTEMLSIYQAAVDRYHALSTMLS